MVMESFSSSISTEHPSARIMSAVMSTSPTRGVLSSVLGALPSKAATMCLVTAFLEPRTRTEPFSGPAGSTIHVAFGVDKEAAVTMAPFLQRGEYERENERPHAVYGWLRTSFCR